MKKFVSAILLWLWLSLCLFGQTCPGDIIHTDTPGLTLYARFRSGPTTAIAVAISDASLPGFYTVSDASILSAGLSSAGTYTYKVFQGTPSTSANDPLRGYGVLYWSGTAEIPPPVTLASTGTIFAGMKTGTATGGTANSITLDVGSSASNGFYDDLPIQIVGGTGVGQVRWGYRYNGSTRVLIVKRNWIIQPDNTSQFVIWPIPLDFAKWLLGPY